MGKGSQRETRAVHRSARACCGAHHRVCAPHRQACLHRVLSTESQNQRK